jgi:hypothetical protein
MTAANAASNLKASVINNTGTISSDSITTAGGKVFLTAGTVNQSGVVSANSAQEQGGHVTIAGNEINLNTGSKTSATGATGGGHIVVGKSSASPMANTASTNLKPNENNTLSQAPMQLEANTVSVDKEASPRGCADKFIIAECAKHIHDGINWFFGGCLSKTIRTDDVGLLVQFVV